MSGTENNSPDARVVPVVPGDLCVVDDNDMLRLQVAHLREQLALSQVQALEARAIATSLLAGELCSARARLHEASTERGRVVADVRRAHAMVDGEDVAEDGTIVRDGASRAEWARRAAEPAEGAN